MKDNNFNYGTEIGKGIREGMKGLNTCASPKSKKTCEKLIIFPFLTFLSIKSFVNPQISSEPI